MVDPELEQQRLWSVERRNDPHGKRWRRTGQGDAYSSAEVVRTLCRQFQRAIDLRRVGRRPERESALPAQSAMNVLGQQFHQRAEFERLKGAIIHKKAILLRRHGAHRRTRLFGSGSF